jgi:hypothetical protein
LRLAWSSLDDFLAWMNTTVAPAAGQYGYRVIIEPEPKGNVQVDRA